MQDQIYAEAMAQIPKFSFDARVADVFDDMIKRSVPGYSEVLAIQANLIPRILPTQGLIFDLGCSTANLFKLLENSIDLSRCMGVDPSDSMLSKAAHRFDTNTPKWIQSTAENVDLSNAQIVVMNFVLQFTDVHQRTDLLSKIYEALPVGGVLFLSEKVRHTNPYLANLEVEVHHDHKRAMGYSDLEIQQKRDAIENYLRPESLELHLARLNEVGFNAVDVVFKWMNFCSLMAVKS